MNITRKNFEILKRAALEAAQTNDILQAIAQTEEAAQAASAKTSRYILEKRKKNPLYCR